MVSETIHEACGALALSARMPDDDMPSISFYEYSHLALEGSSFASALPFRKLVAPGQASDTTMCGA